MRRILNFLTKDVLFKDSVKVADDLIVEDNLTIGGNFTAPHYSYLNTVNVTASFDHSGSLFSSSASMIFFANLPTSDPSFAGQLWNDSGTLKISAG